MNIQKERPTQKAQITAKRLDELEKQAKEIKESVSLLITQVNTLSETVYGSATTNPIEPPGSVM